MARKKKQVNFKPKPNKESQQRYKDNLALIKKLMAFIVLLCCIGCTSQKSCEAYAQCDELYITDYNCDITQRNYYGVDRDYYPNVQTVYYYPRYVRTIRPTTPPIPHSEPKNTTSKPRPSIVRHSRSSE